MQVRVRLSSGASPPPLQPFATPADYQECRRLLRQFGSSYFFASLLLPTKARRNTQAVYGFVRVPDEWVDNPGAASVDEARRRLQDWRNQLLCGLDGVCPDHPVMKAFCDVCRETQMPIEEPLMFLDSMAQDLDTVRYPTYRNLQGYMRGSASAVGMMMCSVLDAPLTPEVLDAAKLMGEAMQLTNFIRDVGEDAARGRIYLPLEDLQRFDVSEDDILKGVMSDRMIKLLQWEIERARHLYREAEPGIDLLHKGCRHSVRLASRLYSRILNKIEQNGYDVFRKRARTTGVEKVLALVRVVVGQ